jgi:hypothetical protein
MGELEMSASKQTIKIKPRCLRSDGEVYGAKREHSMLFKATMIFLAGMIWFFTCVGALFLQ